MQKMHVLRAGAAATIIVVLAALATVVGPSAQAQSPGTNGVIYFDQGGNIYFAAEGASSSTQVTNTGGFDHPDSCPTNPNQVIFEGATGIFFVNDATAPVVQGPIAGTAAGDDNPVFNNDCSRFAVERGNGISVFAFSSGAASPGALSGTQNGNGALNGPGRNPEWSPDGQRIYFEGDVDPGAADQRTIFFVNSNTGAGQTTAVQSGAGGCGVGGFDCRDVRTFPNGNQLAMELFGAPTGLGVGNVGGPVTPHTASPGAADNNLDVSPDGTKIVVENGGALRVYNSDPSIGGAATFNPRPGLTDPDWALSTAPTTGTPTPTPDTGSITGTVTQAASSGGGGLFGGFGGLFGGGSSSTAPQPLSGATVTTGSGQTATTDASGNYTIPNVAAGNTTLTATAQVSSSSLFGGSSTQTVDCTVPGSSNTTANVTVPAGGTATQNWDCPAASGGSGFGGLGGLFGGGGGFGGLGGLFGGGGFGGLGGLFGGIG